MTSEPASSVSADARTPSPRSAIDGELVLRPVSVDPMRSTDHYRLVVPFAPDPRGLTVVHAAV